MPTITQADLDVSLLLAAQTFRAPLVERLAPQASPDAASHALRAFLGKACTVGADKLDAQALSALNQLARAASGSLVDDGPQPLRLAASAQWAQAFEALLPFCDPAWRDEDGDTVAHRLSSKARDQTKLAPSLACMLASLERFAPQTLALANQEMDLIAACLHGDYTAFERLLDQGANPRLFCNSWTPALAAAAQNQAWILRELLLREPACKDDMDQNRVGILALATCGADEETFLIALGACDPNTLDGDDQTPLGCAIDHDFWHRAIDLARRCDLTQKDSKGQGPLHWLASREIHLVDAIEPHAPLPRAWSDLGLDDDDQAFVECLPALVELFGAAANAFEPDSHGRTPFDLLDNYSGHPAAAKWMREAMRAAQAKLQARELHEHAQNAPVRGLGARI